MKYICPMHSDVQKKEPGKCPKCGMDLVPAKTSIKKTAFLATSHCLTGCAIGEVTGMILASIFLWSNLTTIFASTGLAFLFGYSLTMFPLLRSGMSLNRALPIAFASDTVSITIMEIVDNGFISLIPGALAAGLNTFLFWWTLALSLVLAFFAAWPVNMWLIGKGKGHAAAHKHH